MVHCCPQPKYVFLLNPLSHNLIGKKKNLHSAKENLKKFSWVFSLAMPIDGSGFGAVWFHGFAAAGYAASGFAMSGLGQRVLRHWVRRLRV